MQNIIIIISQTVHLLIFRYLPATYHSQSRSTLYNHQSTHLPLPRLSLSVGGRLVADLYFLPLWETQNVRTHFQKCRIFMK